MNGTIVEVDPKKLTLAGNVRVDTKLDPDFLASVKELGVLQPPTVIAAGKGYSVIIGQRRTLAAVQAGLKAIDVYLVDEHEAAGAVIVDQLTENEQRQSLTNAERAGGYQQLALIGWSADEIATRTRKPKKQVAAAIAIANNDSIQAVVTEHDIDLEQAAQILEFADNKKAREDLIYQAKHAPNNFAYTLLRLREAAKKTALKAKLTAQLKEQEVPKAKAADYTYYAIGVAGARINTLANAAGKDLTLAMHKKCPGHAAYVSADAYSTPEIVYVCTDWEANGHQKRSGTRPQPARTPEQIAAAEAAAEKAAKLEEDLKITRELRETFLTNLLQRNKPTTLPGADKMIALALASDLSHARYYDQAAGMLYAVNLLQVDVATDAPRDQLSVILERIIYATKDPLTVALAAALGLFEHNARNIDRRGDLDANKLYFEQLATWGHNLSDREQAALASTIDSIARRDAPVEEPTELDDPEDAEYNDDADENGDDE
ncbi:MAG: ParB/RepB/Spo0J family partition protein [Rhodoglobus sp.]